MAHILRQASKALATLATLATLASKRDPPALCGETRAGNKNHACG